MVVSPIIASARVFPWRSSGIVFSMKLTGVENPFWDSIPSARTWREVLVKIFAP